jgi:BASS family bile acid:Na+ symporter
MLGMGALLGPRDFVAIVRSPAALIVGLVLQLGLVPLTAFAIGAALAVPAGIAAGLVLVAAVPGGTMSNVVTHLGRGNIALSIGLTAVTTAGALATTPILLRLYVGDFLPADFEMPVGQVAFEIGLTLLVPLALGMAIGERFANLRQAFSKWTIRGSLAVIAVIIVGAAGSDRLDPRSYGALGLASIALLCAAFQLLAWLCCRGARLGAADRLAVVIEVTIRNTNLAILLKASLFPAEAGKLDPIGDGMFFAAALYGGFAILFAAPPVVIARRSG